MVKSLLYRLARSADLFKGGCPVIPATKYETACLGDGPFEHLTAWIQDFKSNYAQTDSSGQKWDFTSVMASVGLGPPGLGALLSIGGRVNLQIKNDRTKTSTVMTMYQRYVQKATNIKMNYELDEYVQALPNEIYYLDGYTNGYWSELKFHFTFDKNDKLKSFQAFFWIKIFIFKLEFKIFDIFSKANKLKATCTVFLKQLKPDGTILDITQDVDISDPSQTAAIVENWVSRVKQEDDNYKPMEYIFKSGPKLNNGNSGKGLRELIVFRAMLAKLVDFMAFPGSTCIRNGVTIVENEAAAQNKLNAMDGLINSAMAGTTIQTKQLAEILNPVEVIFVKENCM